jgi:hypothetical protein
LGDVIPRASYGCLISEGEGFGWLFGARFGTVETEGTTTKSAENKNKHKHLLYLSELDILLASFMPLHKSCMLLFLFQNNKFPIYL